MHFFAPPNLPRVPKNVVFVIDHSGSMKGQKMTQVRLFPQAPTPPSPTFASTPSAAAHLSVSIAQTREAMTAILKDLHREDHFAVIKFDSNILAWKDTLVKATRGNVSEAIAYVKRIKHDGG